MTDKIEGKHVDVKAVRVAFDDADSGLPNQARPCPVCGAFGYAVLDDDDEVVQCTGCLSVLGVGDIAATIRVFRDEPDPAKPDKDSLCDVTEGLAALVANPELEPDPVKQDKVKKVKIKV